MSEAFHRSQPSNLPNFSKDRGGGTGDNGSLQRYVWTPLQEHSWCGDAVLAEQLMGRGYTLVNAIFAERFRQAGKIVVPRMFTPQEQQISQVERDERAFVVIDPEAAELRLIPNEFMQNPRVVR